VKKLFLFSIAALFLATGTTHAYSRTDQEILERYAHEMCRDLQTTSEAAYQRCYKEHMRHKEIPLRERQLQQQLQECLNKGGDSEQCRP
jgi:hypothetical protein